MNGHRHKIWFGCFAAAAMLSAWLVVPGISYGQSLKEQIVGTWRLASFYNEEKGAKTYSFGDKPVGLLMFDRSGNVMQFLSNPGTPKFAVSDRLKGTDAENRVVVHSIIAGIGSYTVEGVDTITISWVVSSYPNRDGVPQKRSYKVTGDDMVSINPGPGGTSYSSYTRAK